MGRQRVAYLILTILPLYIGGGNAPTVSCTKSFRLDVVILRLLFSDTSRAVSSTLKIRCFDTVEVNIMGTSWKGLFSCELAPHIEPLFESLFNQVPLINHNNNAFPVFGNKGEDVHVLSLYPLGCV